MAATCGAVFGDAENVNRRAGKNAGRGLIPNRIDISERPAIVARKTRLGDWEGDTVVSAGHKERQYRLHGPRSH